jgi:WD40 repeat protein
MPTHILSVKPSSRLRSTLPASKEAVRNLVFAPDGKTIASAGGQGEVALWDVASRKQVFALPPHGQVYGLAFTPDSKRLLVPSYELIDAEGKWLRQPFDERAVKGLRGGVRVIDIASSKQVGWLRRDPGRGVMRVSVAGDGKTIAVQELMRRAKDGHTDRVTAVLDLTTGKAVADVPGEEVLFGISPDGKTLVRRGEKGGVLWDLASAKVRATLTQKDEHLGQTVISHDGRTIAGLLYVGDAVRVGLWEMASGKRLKDLTVGSGSSILSLALSPDGSRLAVGQRNRSRTVEPCDVLVWDVKTGKQVLALRGHVNTVLALDFHPDGKMLASGGADGTVRLWEIDAETTARR